MHQGQRCKAHRLWATLILLALLGSLIAGCGLRASGQDLVQGQCTRCHTLAPIEVKGRTQVQWEDVVYRMIEHGANLSQGQAQRVVEYLTENYGPGEQ
jgi:hypothetical protein